MSVRASLPMADVELRDDVTEAVLYGGDQNRGGCPILHRVGSDCLRRSTPENPRLSRPLLEAMFAFETSVDTAWRAQHGNISAATDAHDAYRAARNVWFCGAGDGCMLQVRH